MSLHQGKQNTEGACAAKIAICGLNRCTVSDSISLPPGKILRAQEILARSCFGPGVTRTHLRNFPELRRKADRWGLRNRASGPELHVIDKLSRSKHWMSTPSGDITTAKQVYFEFLETMRIFRTHICDPHWWGSSYRPTFYNALTSDGGLSFCEERAMNVWIWPDAALTTCSAVNHAYETFSVFTKSAYVGFTVGSNGDRQMELRVNIDLVDSNRSLFLIGTFPD